MNKQFFIITTLSLSCVSLYVPFFTYPSTEKEFNAFPNYLFLHFSIFFCFSYLS